MAFHVVDDKLSKVGVDNGPLPEPFLETGNGLVQQHAAMLSFVDVFRLLGVIFLCLLPLVLLMKRPRTTAGAAAAH